MAMHPRDYDTCVRILLDDDEREEQDARDRRFVAASAELKQRMGGG